MNALEIVFKDEGGVIKGWDDYCAMMDGVHACVEGYPLLDNQSEAWQLGWRQSFEHLEHLTGVSEQ